MGNCQCKPKEGGESLKDFLARKFHKISKKRKIDDLVSIAIHTESVPEAGTDDGPDGHVMDLELMDLEDETIAEDEVDLDTDDRVSTSRDPHDLINKSVDDCCELPSSRKEMYEQCTEGNDLIRRLEKQLREVQSEIASLQKDAVDNSQEVFTDSGDQSERYSVRSAQSDQPNSPEYMAHEADLEINDPGVTSGYRKARNGFLQAQGDTSHRQDSRAMCQTGVEVTDKGEISSARKSNVRRFEKGDTERKVQQMPRNEGRNSRMLGMITEGLRTRSDAKPARKQDTCRQTLKNKKPTKVDKSADNTSKIAEKIAALQKRDPTLPRPDKGIVWPKTITNLSKTDKAYYVEQFLRSELYRQRCLRKYQGSKTWMNGLTPFQLWILEHEDTDELDAALRPLPKRQNNAQAKIACWRGNTPPPRPPPRPKSP